MDDALTERVEALERAVTDGNHDLSGLVDEADALERLEQIEEQLETLQDHVTELEAATQALRGYVGNIRAVNEDVEKRAELALSKVEALETDTETTDGRSQATDTRSQNPGSNVSNGRERRGSTQTDSERSCVHASSEGHSRESMSRTRQTRCERCGSVQSSPAANSEHPTPTGRTGSDTGSVTRTNGTGAPTAKETSVGVSRTDESGVDTEQSRVDPFDSLGNEDPLVSEDSEDGGGRLSRFRELL